MDDRELLENASIAHRFDRSGGLSVFKNDGSNCPRTWNPLTDDGDALRLAVKWKLDVDQYDDYIIVLFHGGYMGSGRIYHQGDAGAATRRAIVWVASEIGKLILKSGFEKATPCAIAA